MYALKDKVSERFSSLFSNSTSSESPKPPAPDPHTQARPKSKGRKSLSSYLSLVIPSIHGPKPASSRQDANAIQSPSVRYCDANTDFQEEGSDTFLECSIPCKTEAISSSHGENNDWGSAYEKVKLNKLGVDDDPASRWSTCSSDVFEEASERPTPRNPLSDLTDESAFITPDLYEFLGCCLPNIVKGCKWVLLYSTMKHGISLQTLIRKSHNLSGPSLLIVGDTRGAIFGGLLECPLKPSAKRKYQGTHQTFVFTTKYGDPRLFRATGANHYYYICLNDLLALGGGGSFALSLDGDLLSGTSGPCDTFGSLCLAHDPEFELKNVEFTTSITQPIADGQNLWTPVRLSRIDPPPPKGKKDREREETVGYDKLAVMEKGSCKFCLSIREESQKQKKAKGQKLKELNIFTPK